MVFTEARKRGIPILMVTSGGYQATTARVIADSIINLYNKNLIAVPTEPPPEHIKAAGMYTKCSN